MNIVMAVTWARWMAGILPGHVVVGLFSHYNKL